MQTQAKDHYQTADEMRRDLKGLLPTALCPHCGAAVRQAARYCQNCSLAQNVRPLVFLKGAVQATTVAELVQACDLVVGNAGRGYLHGQAVADPLV